MEQICLVIPVLPDRTNDAREFMRELEASRKDEYARSEERIGITKEVWFLAPVADGDALVAYMETNDFGNALGLFSQSQDEFDMWFKRRMADATGVDLNDPPEMTLPELLSSYSASRPSRRRDAADADHTPESVASPDDTPIAVWRSGDGPPLVLVHGATADHSRWAPVLPAFEARFTVLAVDRRGRGASGDAADYAPEREYEDVAAVVDWVGEPVSLLGHSYGGVCALEAARLTDGIGRLILYEAPMGFLQVSPPVVERLQALLEAGEHDELLTVFMSEVAGLPAEQIELLRSLPAWEARLAAAHTIPREERANREYVFDAERFRGVAVPTLLLQGSDSPHAFMAAAEAVDAALSDCRIAVMPGQRHAAIDTGTDLFVSEVLRFLGPVGRI